VTTTPEPLPGPAAPRDTAPRPGEDYRVLNRASWDERVPAHVASADYGVLRFAADPSFLSDVVRFDLPRLGDVAGLRGVHLQCHIGTDTVSLSRLGAHMTGLDFSAPAVGAATDLAAAAGAGVDFVHSDVYDAVDRLGAHGFDLVYTGVGALCWLPDIRRWAGVVSGLLAPGGRLFLREGHPMMWSIEEEDPDGRLVVEYPYVETAEPLVFESSTTYVDTAEQFAATRTHSWNHGLGEVVTALLDEGLVLTQLVEHDSVPWESFRGRMDDVGGGEWRLSDRPKRMPHSYTLQAYRP
jgi:SAM-dependent methyltransferase